MILEIIKWDGIADTANAFIGESFGIDWEYLHNSDAIRMKSDGRTCCVGDYLVKRPDFQGVFSIASDLFERFYSFVNNADDDSFLKAVVVLSDRKVALAEDA